MKDRVDLIIPGEQTGPVPAPLSHAVDAQAPEPTAAPLLRVEGVTVVFPGTLALDRVDFEVLAGEIHALVGENGAGKSTLIKVLAGIYHPDEGQIWFGDQPYDFSGTRIAFIHQDLGLFAPYTVAENIAVVAGYPRPHGLISWSQNRARARAVLASMGSTVDPDETVAALTSAERSIVAIARALAQEAEILILDEPTAALPETDVRRLFEILHRLKEGGMGVVFVSHRLDEVFRIGDRVTVLRDGRRIVTERVADTTPARLIFDIVGREVSELFVTPPPPAAEILLELEGLKVGPVGPISLQLHRGEILGLVGVRGAGQDLVGRAVFGDTGAFKRAGTIRIHGRETTLRGPAGAMRAGVGFVSSKRADEGIAGRLTVRENIYPNPLTWGKTLFSFISPPEERTRVGKALERYDVRPRDPERAVGTLSGGNQQKTILARWLEAHGQQLLVLEEPTFGVDVGAKAEIYRILERDLAGGSGILLVSSDFEEVAGIAHRALVFWHGQVVAEVPKAELSVARLTELASRASEA